MPHLDCASIFMLCRPAPWLLVAAALDSLVIALGFFSGWRCDRPSAPKRIFFERVVLFVLVLMLLSNWAYERGNPWWVLSLPPTLVAIPIVSLMLPYVLARAAAATIRERTDICREITRIVLILALIPVAHVLINDSGIWPTRTSEQHMAMVFHRNRAVFDRIAAKYDAALPPECRPECPTGRVPDSPADAEVLLLQLWLDTDAGYWRSDGTLALKWWDVGVFDGVWLGYVYSPGGAPVPWRTRYRPLGGKWYLASGTT